MLQFKPQGLLGSLADKLMIPIMYLLQGTFSEVPQRTHRWNNHKFTTAIELLLIHALPRVHFDGDESASVRWLGFIPRFHMPIFGGWKKFVVLKPVCCNEPWHVGWLPTDGDCPAISLIPISNLVRVTIGDSPVSFYGISQSGECLELVCVGEGRIGKAGTFRNILLL